MKRCAPEFQAIIEQGYEVIYSPLPTQHAIVATLSCLDDKIALNNRINANLEAQAQAIFKSWFVDFEPWGGVMPDNWRKAALGDLCTLVTTIKALPLLLPPMETLAEYSTLITPIFKQVFRNYGENRTLAAIRDALLPKLMRGELEVEEENYDH